MSKVYGADPLPACGLVPLKKYDTVPHQVERDDWAKTEKQWRKNREFSTVQETKQKKREEEQDLCEKQKIVFN